MLELRCGSIFTLAGYQLISRETKAGQQQFVFARARKGLTNLHLSLPTLPFGLLRANIFLTTWCGITQYKKM
jgi:hypothetical protein